MSQQVIDKLNGLLADAVVFYYKLHNYHWFVTGPSFFTLHEQFEVQYTSWATHLDDIAERILQLGGKPHPTLAAVLQSATTDEETGWPDAKTMVERTIADMKAINERIIATIRAAEEADDRSTTDLLDDISDEVEKSIWMFQAQSGG
jgi:starvation-inducible DNA-binding protein